jgi:preprotein translocase subunit SecA
MILTKLLYKWFGTPSSRTVKNIRPLLQEIHNIRLTSIQILSDEELASKTAEFRKRLEQGEELESFLVEAFAVCQEACDRRIGMFNVFRAEFAFDAQTLNAANQEHYSRVLKELSDGKPEELVYLPASFYANIRELYPNSVKPFRMMPFDVQLIGGVVLHRGWIAEMATGEGKTLAAACPVYLNALSGKGVHVVTVNDYLAERDSKWMGQAYKFLGLHVGLIVHGLNSAQRREAYGADITYGTNNEFGFDYLRDNMATETHDLVQRPLNYCIVDEVDSILIDEARTPLIISGPAEQSTERYMKADAIIPYLKENVHYHIDEKSHNVTLTDEGVTICEQRLGVDNLYGDINAEWVHHVNQALKANFLFKRDVDYIVNQDKEIVIVDEHTGRLMEGRRYSEGLHQAIEAKEKVPIARENQTLATITFQNLFRMYNKLAGMTGTAETEATEFEKIYRLRVVAIPTHKPLVRDDMSDLIYRSEDEKYDAVLKDIKERHQKGQPVLVGTISIEKSERLAKLLTRNGIKHEVLNAKNHHREAEIIKYAGHEGRVTIATNMAGRGTDIVLGPGVEAKGGLHVLGTERHESRRIDNQLRGRSGRQGDPGSSQFYLSLDDDLLRIFGGDRIKNMMTRLGAEPGEVISHPFVNRAIANAQKRVEGQHFESRKHLLEYDDVMNNQRKVIYSLRQRILAGEDIREEIVSRLEEAADIKVSQYIIPGSYAEEWELENLKTELRHAFGIEWDVDASKELSSYTPEIILDEVIKLVQKRYDNLFQILPEAELRNLERRILLMTIDHHYKEHLLAMDHLRDAIRFHGYAQKDPLMVYKKEGFSLFERCLESITTVFAMRMMHIKVETSANVQNQAPRAPVQTEENRQEIKPDSAPRTASGFRPLQPAAPPVKKVAPVRKTGNEPGRNDPCWCGSGKKFKKCHGRDLE